VKTRNGFACGRPSSAGTNHAVSWQETPACL